MTEPDSDRLMKQALDCIRMQQEAAKNLVEQLEKLARLIEPKGH